MKSHMTAIDTTPRAGGATFSLYFFSSFGLPFGSAK